MSNFYDTIIFYRFPVHKKLFCGLLEMASEADKDIDVIIKSHQRLVVINGNIEPITRNWFFNFELVTIDGKNHVSLNRYYEPRKARRIIVDWISFRAFRG